MGSRNRHETVTFAAYFSSPMKALHILVPSLLVMALLASGVAQAAAGDSPPTEAPTVHERAAADDAERSHAAARACFGGLEDGKLVVLKARLADGSEQTTVEGCRVGGGVTNRLPRSPTIALGQTVFA